MKALKIGLSVLFILVVVVFLYALTLPKESTVTRSIDINAPEALVFDLVSNHKSFQLWSPWSKRDPNMEITYEGPEKGVGSKITWKSDNPEVGNGTSEYIEYLPYSRAVTRLKFDQGGGDATLSVQVIDQNQVKVIWDFYTAHESILERYFGLMIEGMVGKDYEKGLADLKVLAESAPVIETKTVSYEVNGVTLTGHLAKPVGVIQAPGVLVIHEWWGHNDYARKRADMLAELGYVAFALDMYGDGKLANHPQEAKDFMMQVVGAPEVAVARFDKALSILKEEGATHSEKVAAIGYCFGGAVAMSMARSGKDLKGVVSFHGALQGLAPVSESVTTPMLVLNGEADPFITQEQISAFKAEMDASSIPYTFINYPEAKHAFTNPAATEVGQKFNIPLAYQEKADEESWLAMQAFLKDIFQ